jgi:hypothetical protein
MWYTRILARSLWLPAILAMVSACGDGNGTGPGPNPVEGFRGPYALDQWTASGITGGSTSILPIVAETDTAWFAYTVNLGNPGQGVSHRTATFSATAARSGTVTLDWQYTGYHAFFLTNATLVAFAAHASGAPTEVVEINQEAPGGFSFSGSTTIDVEAGQTFGVTIGGRNFDSDSRLNGTLKVFNFSAP